MLQMTLLHLQIINYCFLFLLIEMIIATTAKKIRGDQEKKDMINSFLNIYIK